MECLNTSWAKRVGEKEERGAMRKTRGWKAWGMGNEDRREGRGTRKENNSGSLRLT